MTKRTKMLYIKVDEETFNRYKALKEDINTNNLFIKLINRVYLRKKELKDILHITDLETL